MSNYTHLNSECLSSLSVPSTGLLRAAANIPGLVAVTVFYAVVFAVGIYASLRAKQQQLKSPHVSQKEHVMLAGRNLGGIVGLFTGAATILCGGTISGTVEFVFNPLYGLAWCQTPFFSVLSLLLNGLFFVKPMRDAGYLTLMDPFQKKFGRIMTALLYIPSLLGSIIWTGAILASLGTTLSVIIGLNYVWAVPLSSLLALLYTVVGGLHAVAYTDVIQLVMICLGLWVVLPFALTNEATTNIIESAKWNPSWLGSPITGPWIMVYIDFALVLSCGAIPTQEYFQRALSVKTTKTAVVLSILCTVLAWILMIPPVLLGAVAASTEWNMTGYREFGQIPVPECDYPLALPMVMRFLTPTPVAILGLAAMSSAVMSSTDSAILAASSLFAVNIYKPLRDALSRSCCRQCKIASDNEIVWAMRVSMVFVAIIATVIAVSASSIYHLLVLVSDFVYVVIFPQFVCIIHIPFSNAYGSFVAFWTCSILRLASGEPSFGLPALIRYPYYDVSLQMQVFPFRTFIMLTGLLLIALVSLCARWLANVSSTFRRLDCMIFNSFFIRNNNSVDSLDLF